ncbi:MAG: asparagine synthase (glutamine-hydrolyzing) [Planctomycetes bacterium]|nr:asparagine synthase (glutamine-hydrolyzing) [Planctomycetota bacterium]
MCGIAGIVYRDRDRSPDERTLVAMRDTLAHRGPDGVGVWRRGPAGLAHRRLAIIDVAGGAQPVENEDGSIAITFNGQIYNYRELREGLVARGHRFRTQCDTEVIVHLYEEEGERCVEKLRGMFAFAIWDAHRNRLLLARDRLGIKPLYWRLDDESLTFGSELKAILAALATPPAIDHTAILDYLVFLYVPAPKTIFREIQKLPPGHTLTLDSRGATLRKYWDVRFEENPTIGIEEAAERLRELIDESVRIRLMSEVPLGAFLSGGLDSSAVVASMVRASSSPVKTSSVGFRESAFDELPFARLVADRLGTDHHESIVSAEAARAIELLAPHYDEPFADSSAVPTYHLSRVTRERVTVALSGDGGDENFAGYRRYRFDLLEGRLRSLVPSPLRRPILGGLAAIYPKADWLPRPLRAKTFLAHAGDTAERAYYDSVAGVSESFARSLLSADVRRQLDGYTPFRAFESHFRAAGTSDPLARLLYVDLKTYLPDDILTKVDRASMAHSLEVRVPLLDHVLVEFAATLPSRMKLSGSRSKVVLKRAVARDLPSDIVDRRKQGFSIPLAAWLRGELRERAEEGLASLGSSGLFDPAALRSCLDRHVRGTRDHATPLWALISFDAWARRFATKRGETPSLVAAGRV